MKRSGTACRSDARRANSRRPCARSGTGGVPSPKLERRSEKDAGGVMVAGPLPVLTLAGRGSTQRIRSAGATARHPELPLGSGRERKRPSYKTDRSWRGCRENASERHF